MELHIKVLEPTAALGHRPDKPVDCRTPSRTGLRYQHPTIVFFNVVTGC